MENLIERYRLIRNFRSLNTSYRCGYAFVGIGSHSTQNLYPVINYLHVPLSYICCKDKRKIPLIEERFKGTKATTDIEKILSDSNIDGVFVSVTSKMHFNIAKKVLAAGKSLFIEKPPCQTSKELKELTEIEEEHKNAVSLVGLQKRYSPCIKSLFRQLKQLSPISYRYVYATGLYPEGNPLTELLIHPLDLMCYLFGKPEIKSVKSITPKGKGLTLLIMLEHKEICGIMELSTNYSWREPVEELSVNTTKGILYLNQTERLTFKPHGTSLRGIPLDKVFNYATTEKHLWHRDSFSPTFQNNQIYTQGYFSEIKTFTTLVEKHEGNNLSPLSSLTNTYNLIDEISTLIT